MLIAIIGKYIFVVFFNLFVIRNVRCSCSSIEMLQDKVARFIFQKKSNLQSEKAKNGQQNY